MALWTPYADAPLDLTVKEKNSSPARLTNLDPYYNQQYQQPYLAPPGWVDVYPPPYYPPYYPAYVQVDRVSPESTGSYSTFEAPNPSQTVCRPPTLSPPESPPSVNYMQEAEVLSNDPDFQAFERDALRAMAEKNGGSLLGSNPRMRRAVQTTQAADEAYRKQRERNNFAAKQSRDRRKLREIHLALKVAYLKNQVSKLKTQLAGTTCSRCRQLC